MNYEIKQKEKFRYVEEGTGEPIVLLHGLFGALSNFQGLIEYFRFHNRVIVPLLPLLDMDILHTSVGGLAKYVHRFLESLELENVHLLGNSLGGHVALVHTLKNPSRIRSLILTGSSGLFENGMGDSYPRRGDYEYIKNKTALTFYDPAIATKEIVDEVYETVNDRNKLIKTLAIAKSAIRHNMAKDLPKMNIPTCIIWGKNDNVTPPEVAVEFDSLLPDSDLFWIDKCGHAAMMEHPQEFNNILDNWLNKRDL